MTFNFLGPGLTVNVEAKVKEQIILDSSGFIPAYAGNSPKQLMGQLCTCLLYTSPSPRD